jgi:hypothetical protein
MQHQNKRSISFSSKLIRDQINIAAEVITRLEIAFKFFIVAIIQC